MGATNSFESEVLRHILLNEAILNIGDTAGLLPSSVAGDVFVCLLTVDPGEIGSIVNEAAYAGYARVAVPRGSGGWQEANGTIRNFADIDFPECTGGTETETHFGVCKTLTGDDMIYYGELPAPALIVAATQPRFSPSQLELNLD